MVISVVSNSGEVPATQKQNCSQQADGDHVGVFAEEEQSPLQGTVFRVPATNQLLFAFREVKRKPICLRK